MILGLVAVLEKNVVHFIVFNEPITIPQKL